MMARFMLGPCVSLKWREATQVNLPVTFCLQTRPDKCPKSILREVPQEKAMVIKASQSLLGK